MGKAKKDNKYADLEKIIEEITTDAYGEDECYGAFQTVLEDEIGKECAGIVFGEDVTIVGWDYRNERKGVIAKCRKKDGKVFEVAAWEVEVAEGTPGEGWEWSKISVRRRARQRERNGKADSGR
jgi:hypothetical protein